LYHNAHSWDRFATLIRSLGPKSPDTRNACTNGEYDDTIRPSAITLNGDFLSPSALSSIDNGRGHVSVLRATGITHASLGNHEADLKLSVLKERLGELRRRGRIVVLNSNVSGMGRHSRELDIVSSSCGRINVGLLGLLSDEAGMFRDGTFRGLQISDVKKKYQMMMEKIRMMKIADCLVPLTHQSLSADTHLAKWMLELQTEDQPSGGVILGGHEHIKIHELLSQSNGGSVQIVKTGYNCERAAIVDLKFNSSTRILENTEVHFVELDEHFKPCQVVKSIVEKHLSALDHMQNFTVFDKKTMLSGHFVDPLTSENLPLSSKFARYEQTTVGAFFCTAIQLELGVDCCIINGAPIKASKVYANGTMSYDDLRNELPFPLKMIVVDMTRKELREAIEYSRSNVEKGKSSVVMEDGRTERRGYLQTDFDYWRHSSMVKDHSNDNQVLSVALPRNLLKGFCKIQPLMELRHELESRNALPNEDDYLKAIDLIARYCCKDRWTTIAQQFSFSDLDLNQDGYLCREEIRIAIKRAMGHEPSNDLVDEMASAFDEDTSGFVDEYEFNQILNKVRSQS